MKLSINLVVPTNAATGIRPEPAVNPAAYAPVYVGAQAAAGAGVRVDPSQPASVAGGLAATAAAKYEGVSETEEIVPDDYSAPQITK